MKKWLLIVLFVLLFLSGAVYYLIPGQLNITCMTAFRCTQNEFKKCLQDTAKWSQWLPAGAVRRDSTPHNPGFLYKGCYYKLIKNLFNGAEFSLKYKDIELITHIEGLTLQPDSLVTVWQGNFKTGGHPFRRIGQYRSAAYIRENMKTILSGFGSFVIKPVNVYGFAIQRTSFQDTLLLAVRKGMSSYPGTKDLSGLVKELKDYIAIHGAGQTDAPMFDVRQKDSTHYFIMMAIAIDKIIPEDKNYFIIRMAHMDGKFVSTDVKGGPATIKEAHRQIENYMNDRLLTSPGIPFEIMVTDRSTESDTSKWLTKIYYPST